MQQKVLTKCYLYTSFEHIRWWSKLSKSDIQMAISTEWTKIWKVFFWKNTYCIFVSHVPSFQLSTRSTGYNNVRNPASSACRQGPNFVGRKGREEEKSRKKRKKKKEKKEKEKKERKRKETFCCMLGCKMITLFWKIMK